MSKNLDEKQGRVLSQLFSDTIEISLGAIVVEGFKGVTELKAGVPDPDARARRGEIITAVRGGQHVELAVAAEPYSQKKGRPNRRALRFADSILGDIVGTWANQPFLYDHVTWSSDERKGTILDSKLHSDGRNGLHTFQQTFRVVKPDAVISALDGTLDRFSIGWFPLSGPILCTIHGCDVRSADSCMCWPGQVVMVDGKKQIAEYEFQTAQGKETSNVTIPAVEFTSVEDVRTMLTAELGLNNRTRASVPVTPPQSEGKTKMAALPRLAMVLGLSSIDEATEDRAIQAVEGLRKQLSAAEQERDTALSDAKTAKATLATLTASASKVRVDAMLAQAYKDGKLRHGRDADGNVQPSGVEKRLRRIALGEHGLADLEAELAELPVVVPVRQRQAADQAPRARIPATRRQLDARGGGGGQDEPELEGDEGDEGGELADEGFDAELRNVARAMGLKESDVINTARQLGYEEV